MLYKEITERIIASAIEVHKTLGSGFQEIIYQRALEIEMPHHNLQFDREKVLSVFYKDIGLCFLQFKRLHKFRRVISFPESLVSHQLLMKRDRRLNAFNNEFTQRTLHRVQCFVSGLCNGDQLRNHRIVIRRNHITCINVRVDPNAVTSRNV